MAREFIVPGKIISGSGALEAAESALKAFGKKALIVTDKVMIDLGNCAKVEAALKNEGVDYVIYSDITGEPTDVMIDGGAKVYKENGCDFIVALGGGSPIDSMKAIASLIENGGSISDYMGKVIDVPVPPMVAIPTTAGTGSGCNSHNCRNRIGGNTVYNYYRYKKGYKNALKRRCAHAYAGNYRPAVYNDSAA